MKCKTSAMTSCGDRAGAVPGDVGHRDAPRAASIEVDHVGTCRQHADVPKVGERVDLGSSDDDFVGEQCQRAARPLYGFARLGARVNDELALRAEFIP